ncbi:MAG: hypothetical protein ACLQG3_19585 [Terracidiphilus sp.]
MQRHASRGLAHTVRATERDPFAGASAPAAKCWPGARARRICPRRYLRVLPNRTRPSLFGGD